ncbi:MAG: hypothetical protein GY778_24410 [bacterium]|nr:hypothetical protein [bacterium]
MWIALPPTSEATAPRLAPVVQPGALRGFWKPTLADALFVLLMLRVLQLGATGLFNDPGTGWHLRTGHEILATETVPITDTFSYPRYGQSWVQTQWLGDVLLAGLFGLGGYSLIALATAGVIAGVFRWIYRTQVAAGSWPAVALIVTLIAAGAASGHFLARPLVASTIGIPLCFWWATLYARGEISARRPWLLVPIAIVWANCHPGVLGGIATVGLCGLVTSIAGARRGDSPAGRRGVVLMTVAAAMVAATLVNPYGLSWHGWIGRLMQMQTLPLYVDEWLAPVWHDPATIAAGLLLLVLVLARPWRASRMTVAEALVVMFWTVQAAGSARHVPLLGLILALQLGRVLKDVRIGWPWLRRLGAKVPIFSDEIRTNEMRTPGGLVSLGALAVMAGLLATGTSVAAIGLGVAGPPANRFSPQAVAYLRAHPPTGPLFNDINYGGTLIRDLPHVAVFADDRFGLYGDEFLEQYRAAVLEPQDHAADLLDRWSIQTVLIGPHLPLRAWLADDPAWRQDFADRAAVIFTRRIAAGELNP